VPYESALDKALLACDELTGFVVACTLVRPDGIDTLAPGSVVKKLKNKTFAAKVDRDEIDAGARMLGVPLADHIQFVIDALRASDGDLGFARSPAR
jgi:predicted hydrolase (HD superfamily)